MKSERNKTFRTKLKNKDYHKGKYKTYDKSTVKLKKVWQNISYRETTKYVQDDLFCSEKYGYCLKNETHTKLFFKFWRVNEEKRQKNDVVLEICTSSISYVDRYNVEKFCLCTKVQDLLYFSTKL